jgi:anaerobic magnesium-protoporphyrin IX monomethyl ester cyclase
MIWLNLIRFGAKQVDVRQKEKSYFQKIAETKPKYLVIYDDGFNYLTKMCLTNMREACFEMIEYGKKEDCIVIVCSSDSSDHFEKYLDNGADFILKGEGEITLIELFNCLEKSQPVNNVDGLIYRQDAATIINSARKVLQNLDELPFPAWDLVDIKSYQAIWKQSGTEFTLNIATTRGCPYKCNWCAKPIYGNRYNAHSPKYIVEEIAFLKQKYNVSRFWMCDDIFGLKPNWVQEFNKELKNRKLAIKYLQLEEESSALSKALASGDRDLAFSVILHLRKKLSSTDFHMMIRKYPLGKILYQNYCRQHDQVH